MAFSLEFELPAMAVAEIAEISRIKGLVMPSPL
jgi:hypothetical protein